MNVKPVVLRDLCASVEYGYTASASHEVVGPQFLRITDIVPELIDWSVVPKCEIEPKKLEKFRLRNNDIVVARTGATVGYAKRLKNPPEAVFASYLVRLTIDPVKAHPAFIGAIVESRDYKEFVVRNAGGAAQPNANAQILTSYQLNLPDLPTQRRIASILSAYDDLIENNTRRIAILEEMARRIYEEWFVRFRFPGHEQVKMVESELGLIPEGWSRATLGEVAKVQWGDTSLTKASYVEQGYVAFSASGPDGFLPHFQRDGCGIVLSAIGAQCGKTWLARGQWGTIKNTISLWSLDEELISNEYLYLQCSGESYWPRRGAAQPFISLGDARNCPVLRPTREVMAIFSQVMRSKFQLISILERKNANLRATRDLLLPKLISGELDVSTLPDPEEAIAA